MDEVNQILFQIAVRFDDEKEFENIIIQDDNKSAEYDTGTDDPAPFGNKGFINTQAVTNLETIGFTTRFDDSETHKQFIKNWSTKTSLWARTTIGSISMTNCYIIENIRFAPGARGGINMSLILLSTDKIEVEDNGNTS